MYDDEYDDDVVFVLVFVCICLVLLIMIMITGCQFQGDTR